MGDPVAKKWIKNIHQLVKIHVGYLMNDYSYYQSTSKYVTIFPWRKLVLWLLHFDLGAMVDFSRWLLQSAPVKYFLITCLSTIGITWLLCHKLAISICANSVVISVFCMTHKFFHNRKKWMYNLILLYYLVPVDFVNPSFSSIVTVKSSGYPYFSLWTACNL